LLLLCVCVCVCVCVCKQEFRTVNIHSKRHIKLELFVEHLSVDPLAHRILSLTGTVFFVQPVHSVDEKGGAQGMPLRVI